MRRRVAQLSAIALLLGCAQPSGGRDQFLNRVETRIKMPPDARPIEQYSRSYFWIDGGKKVMGIFNTLSSPGRRWVTQNPGPFVIDGGCAIVTVVLDAATERVELVQCNGVG